MTTTTTSAAPIATKPRPRYSNATSASTTPRATRPTPRARTEGYDTSYKTTPDVEDINQDYTLNEYEKYYQYHVSLRPQDMAVGRNHIVDCREAAVPLRNGTTEKVMWYQFRIPLATTMTAWSSISDFTSMRFMRMYLRGFSRPIVLRFGSLDPVKGEWRTYRPAARRSRFVVGKDGSKLYQHRGKQRQDTRQLRAATGHNTARQDPTQPQLVEANEQALNMVVTNLGNNESKAVYKNTNLDLRQYRRLQMFVHANAMNQNTTSLADDQIAVFIRVGSDYKTNYYEYEIPLKLGRSGSLRPLLTLGLRAGMAPS